jgi:GTPase Era involved in 16S rRNA processing
VLGVNDSNWMQELSLLSEMFKDKINTILGSNQIESIKLKYVSQTKKNVQKKQFSIVLNVKVKALTTEETEALLVIKDQELAQALVGFLQKCHQFS